MKKIHLLTALVMLCLCGVQGSVAAQPRPVKPNVVLLLTDDLGWQDVKCYDLDAPSPMETPNIDVLAKKGVMFWQAYSPAPVCSPSRCAILSGKHPARLQKTSVRGGTPPKPVNQKGSRMMAPWQRAGLALDELTLATVLRDHGYATGHAGKWHIGYRSETGEQGFDYTRENRGSRNAMKPNRLSGFATHAPNDPYRLDENGYPFHQTSEDALTFLRANKDKPFFLYYATWLVHAPIHTRAKEHLEKYARKLGVDPAQVASKATPGQINPFYCAMVQELDYYVGILFDYLDQTEDPRWPGHRLSENTYLIFTSDNGGMEGGPKERYTDNNPLDRGKISAKEGGTRVPLVITGPGIPAGVQTDVMVNGLDFYPTILSLTGSPKPKNGQFDGCDIAPLLLGDPTNPSLVKQADGSVRDTMVWHFPNGVALESTIRVGDYKLIRNYDHLNNEESPELELFQLYQTLGGKPKRVDIEEAKNLADTMPEKTQAMNRRLTDILTEMKASYPYYNPSYQRLLPHKDKVPFVLSHKQKGNALTFSYTENGAKVVRAHLIYTLDGSKRGEQWFSEPAKVKSNGTVTAELPKGTTHYLINVIDENNFMVSYPEVKQSAPTRRSYVDDAIKAL